MRDRDLDERLLAYAARVIRLVSSLPKTLVCRRIGDQLLRSATSVGANYQEAQAGESRDDFVHKLQVGLKELRESRYWLKLLAAAEIQPTARLKPILDESGELCRILSKSVATAKKNAP